MSCKSAIFTANTNAQSVAVGGTLALGSTIRRFGCNLNQNGNSITINGCDDAGYTTSKHPSPQRLPPLEPSLSPCSATAWPCLGPLLPPLCLLLVIPWRFLLWHWCGSSAAVMIPP